MYHVDTRACGSLPRFVKNLQGMDELIQGTRFKGSYVAFCSTVELRTQKTLKLIVRWMFARLAISLAQLYVEGTTTFVGLLSDSD